MILGSKPSRAGDNTPRVCPTPPTEHTDYALLGRQFTRSIPLTPAPAVVCGQYAPRKRVEARFAEAQAVKETHQPRDVKYGGEEKWWISAAEEEGDIPITRLSFPHHLPYAHHATAKFEAVLGGELKTVVRQVQHFAARGKGGTRD